MPWKKRFHNVITGKSCGTAIFTFQHIIGEKKIQFTQFHVKFPCSQEKYLLHPICNHPGSLKILSYIHTQLLIILSFTRLIKEVKLRYKSSPTVGTH